MSYFDDASLVMIPSGYKDQKVYSVKPIDGSGDLTFSRASNATRVNSSGLVEKVRTNYLFNSETFSSWATEGGTLTGGFSDPDGGLTAYKYVQTTGGLYSNIAATDSLPKITSVYLKSVDGTSYNVTLGNGSAGNLTVATVTPTWQRFTNANTASSTRLALYIYAIGNAGGVMVWHPQGEYGDIPTDYIATTSSAVSVGPVSGLPRLDYSGGASCPSLILEGQRTNVLQYSEQIDNAAWNKSSVTITANNIVSPDGYTNADLATATAGGELNQGLTLSTSTAYTFSFYVKKGTAADAKYRVYNFDAGVNVVNPTSYISQTNTSTWVRVSVSFTSSATGTNYGIYLLDGASAGTMYFWGAQLEAGAYATSYIPTLSTAVTRVADACSKTGISSLIGQTEGTLFVEFQTLQLNPTNVSRIILSDGTTSNYMFLGLNEAGSGNLSRLYVNNTGAGTSISVFSSTALTVGTNKLAMAYKSGSFALYLNGNLVGSSSSAVTIPATSELVVGGQSPSAITQLETMVDKQIILFKTRLSNADLATLTA